MAEGYIQLGKLEVYALARELATVAWEIYEALSWQDKKAMGGQFIESVDSVGANIAEGYGRFHYLDKIRFYYNSRGSLSESCEHWLELLRDRKRVKAEQFERMKEIHGKLSLKLNNFIAATYRAKRNEAGK